LISNLSPQTVAVARKVVDVAASWFRYLQPHGHDHFEKICHVFHRLLLAGWRNEDGVDIRVIGKFCGDDEHLLCKMNFPIPKSVNDVESGFICVQGKGNGTGVLLA
jgi:hypothetical protein